MFELHVWSEHDKVKDKKISKEEQYIIILEGGFLHIVDIPIPDHTFYTAHQKALDEKQKHYS